MDHRPRLFLHVDPSILERLDRLIDAVADSPEINPLGARRGRSLVARVALLEGLRHLEERFPPPKQE